MADESLQRRMCVMEHPLLDQAQWITMSTSLLVLPLRIKKLLKVVQYPYLLPAQIKVTKVVELPCE
jgi:hypothetical protein